MSGYADPRKALGICDRCGQRWVRSKLKYEVIMAKAQRTLVCPDCLDEDNPQLLLGRVRVDDPRPVWDARPDPSLPQTRSGFGFNPVGGMGFGLSLSPSSPQITNPSANQPFQPFTN